MRKESQSHHHPSQTAPDIYAARMKFAPGLDIEGHSYHQWGINITLSGSCRWQTGAGELGVAAGDVLVNRPNTWRSWRVSTPEPRQPAGGAKEDAGGKAWECAYVHFHPRPHWHEWLEAWEYQGGFALFHFRGEWQREMMRDFTAMVRAYENGGALRDHRTLVALETVLLTLVEHTVASRLGLDDRVKSALEFMHSHYAEPLTVKKLADTVGLSESHFAHLFSAALGETPGECLERLRLARAAEMLRFTTHKVADIAVACGFPDASYFALRFRINIGQPPSAYRAASRP